MIARTESVSDSIGIRTMDDGDDESIHEDGQCTIRPRRQGPGNGRREVPSGMEKGDRGCFD
jgi:hypothetical protein